MSAFVPSHHIETGIFGFGFAFVGCDAGHMRSFAQQLDQAAIGAMRVAELACFDKCENDETVGYLRNVITSAHVLAQIANAMRQEAADQDNADKVCAEVAHG